MSNKMRSPRREESVADANGVSSYLPPILQHVPLFHLHLKLIWISFFKCNARGYIYFNFQRSLEKYTFFSSFSLLCRDFYGKHSLETVQRYRGLHVRLGGLLILRSGRRVCSSVIKWRCCMSLHAGVSLHTARRRLCEYMRRSPSAFDSLCGMCERCRVSFWINWWGSFIFGVPPPPPFSSFFGSFWKYCSLASAWERHTVCTQFQEQQSDAEQ